MPFGAEIEPSYSSQQSKGKSPDKYPKINNIVESEFSPRDEEEEY
jgi:hypothetical protein